MFVRSSSYEALQFSEAQALKPVSAILVVAAALGARLVGGGAARRRRCSAGACCDAARLGVGEARGGCLRGVFYAFNVNSRYR